MVSGPGQTLFFLILKFLRIPLHRFRLQYSSREWLHGHLHKRPNTRICTDIIKHNRYRSRLILYSPGSRIQVSLHIANYAVNCYCPSYPLLILLLLSININYQLLFPLHPYRDRGLSGIKSLDLAPDYSLFLDKIHTISPGINLLFNFFYKCTPVLDVEDPLASSDDEVEMTTPGHPPTTTAAASTRSNAHSSRASSSGLNLLVKEGCLHPEDNWWTRNGEDIKLQLSHPAGGQPPHTCPPQGAL